MKTLQDYNVGDRVSIYVDASNNLLDKSDRNGFTLPCLIISKTAMAVYIGWTSKDIIPAHKYVQHNSYCAGCVAHFSADPDRAVSGLYSDKINNAATSDIQMDKISIDKPCRQCKRNNSLIDKSCWYCQVSVPTDHNRVGP